jgi:hypothetical protein
MNCFKWDALFLFPSPIEEKSVREIPDVRFEKTIHESKITLTGFTVSTSVTDKDRALSAISEKANRVLDYITAIHHIPIKCSLNNFGEVKPPGEPKTRESSVKICASIFKSGFINFLSIKSILENNMQPDDLQLMRQLSHYRRGLECFVETPEDIITQIREFYMILEDEYAGTGNNILSKYSYVRHFVSHYEMDKTGKAGKTPKSYTKAFSRFGQTYADYSKPALMEEIKKDLPNIKKEAEEIIQRKLK